MAPKVSQDGAKMTDRPTDRPTEPTEPTDRPNRPTEPNPPTDRPTDRPTEPTARPTDFVYKFPINRARGRILY